jgi:hypothetical protein
MSSHTQEEIVNLVISELCQRKDYARTVNHNACNSENDSKEEKVLFVEGKTDTDFWKRILNDNTIHIHAVNPFVASVCSILNMKNENNKATVIEVCNAINTPEKSSLKRNKYFQTWIINGVIDRDFDDGGYDAVGYIHVTDTHDLETLMIYSDSDIFKRLKTAKEYNITIADEKIELAKRLSLQMGWIRKACNRLQNKEERMWLYLSQRKGKQSGLDYGLLNDHGNFDILTYLRQLNSLLQYRDQKNDESLVRIKTHLMSTAILKDKILSDGKWKNDYSKVDEFEKWKVINGHDFSRFLKSIVPRAEKAYGTDRSANNALEIDLIQTYDTSKIYGTNLYCSMQKNNFVKSR